MPKEKAPYKCLSMIMFDSVVMIKKKYYPQIPLEECKYGIKKTKMENLIDYELEAKSSDDEADFASGDDEKESDNNKDNDESNE